MAKQKVTVDQDRGEAKATPGGGIVGMIGLAFMAAATVVAKVWEAVMADGTIAASGRMGLDEIGAALKAFPDSLQVSETGTIWNPTQGEIAASRQEGRHTGSYSSYSHSSVPPHPWPSEIAERNRQQPANDHGHDQGHEADAGHSL